MGKAKKHVLAIIAITVASQIDLSLFTHDFMISGGIIAFSIIYYFYRKLNTIITGVISGIFVYILRVLVFMIGGGTLGQGLISFFPEVFFYIVFGTSINVLMGKGFTSKLNNMLYIVFISDILSNGTEMFMRAQVGLIKLNYGIMWTLLIVAIIRSFIVWIILNGLKYYKILLINRENAERYRKFLVISSKLKSEMYLMEKNMDYIEKVMSRAYGLYEKIINKREEDTWIEDSINIAKDIHEIKKDYQLVLYGVKEITEIGVKSDGMNFNDIIDILSEGMVNFTKDKSIKVKFQVKEGENFFTSSHFYLISIFRNLLMNALDAVREKGEKGEIYLVHKTNEDNHIFKITDNGTGIKDEDLKHIFSPGFSTKIDYNTGNINRGLGLTIAKDIVENRLKGNIKVYSSIGDGTTFEVSIPRKSLEVDNS